MPRAAGRTRREAIDSGIRIGLGGLAGAALASGAVLAPDPLSGPDRLLGPDPALASMTTPAGTGSAAPAPVPAPERMRRLLEVEMLMLFAYEHVLSSSLLGPRAIRTLAPLRIQEEAHVTALRERLHALGGVSPAPPRSIAAANHALAHRQVTQRVGQLKGDKDALRLLLAVEKVAVGAYFVALMTLEERSLITLVTEMMGVDAQHEVVIGELLYHGDPTRAVPSGLVQGVQ